MASLAEQLLAEGFPFSRTRADVVAASLFDLNVKRLEAGTLVLFAVHPCALTCC